MHGVGRAPAPRAARGDDGSARLGVLGEEEEDERMDDGDDVDEKGAVRKHPG
jgi:hypothetical protein